MNRKTRSVRADAIPQFDRNGRRINLGFARFSPNPSEYSEVDVVDLASASHHNHCSPRIGLVEPGELDPGSLTFVLQKVLTDPLKDDAVDDGVDVCLGSANSSQVKPTDTVAQFLECGDEMRRGSRLTADQAFAAQQARPVLWRAAAQRVRLLP